jgi:hypothetical protein
MAVNGDESWRRLPLTGVRRHGCYYRRDRPCKVGFELTLADAHGRIIERRRRSRNTLSAQQIWLE